MSCVLTPVIRYIALKKGFVDCPQRARKVHQQATPRLGGVAILVSFLLVLCIASFFVPLIHDFIFGDSPIIGAIVAGAIGIFVLVYWMILHTYLPKPNYSVNFLLVSLCGMLIFLLHPFRF